MSRNNPERIENPISTDVSQRRAFIKKASAGAILTSLPAQSVWGRGGTTCTVSGAMSGNMSGIERHSDCKKPRLPKGRSPAIWETFMLASLSNLDGTTDDGVDYLHSAFSEVNEFQALESTVSTESSNSRGGGRNGNNQLSESEIAAITAENEEKTAENNERLCLLRDIKDVGRLNMSIQSDLIDGSFSVNLYDAIASSSGELDYNLAAVWLNIYFNFSNFAGSYGDVDCANEVVNSLLAYIYINSRSNPSFDFDSFRFNDSSSSNYSPSTC